MRRYRLILRLLTIQRVLLKHGLDEVIGATHLLRPVGWLYRLLPRRGRRGEPLGVRLRLALEELAPSSLNLVKLYPLAATCYRQTFPGNSASFRIRFRRSAPS